MSKINKNSKGVHVSNKNTASFDPGFDFDPFKLDPSLQAELDSKGMVGRFISVKTLEKNGGYHPRGWRPYKREVTTDSMDFLFGKSPDGYIRRDDLVLAVKTKEDVTKHRTWLAHKADELSVQKKMQNAKQGLKDFVKSQGMDDYVSVKDGYED